MFYYIQGSLAHLDPGFAVIDAGGVGYKLTISANTHDAMPPHLTVTEPPTVRLYTYMAVREDGVELFGFVDENELKTFKMLISVSGVGPKAAIAILSILTPEKFALAVCTNDTKAISKASGVGAKTAARIVLELHDKLTKETSEESLLSASLPTADVQKHASGNLKEAMEALVVLGYTKAEATKALQSLDPTLGLEDMIRLGLKQLMRNL